MNIAEDRITVKALAEKYRDSGEDGVVAFSGRLDVRPPYQREFVYDDAKRDAVIKTLVAGRPLNVFYWGCVDNRYELIDGQQRTISICTYVKDMYSVQFKTGEEPKSFQQLDFDVRKAILDTELCVYKCTGTEQEMLDWFETINTAGEKLNKQELRNAVYTGNWLADAKRYFSKSNCPAKNLFSEYMSGNPIRQEYLEEVLSWAADAEGYRSIDAYMSACRANEDDAEKLWLYFRRVVDWVKSIYPKAEKEMKSTHWGILYNKYHDTFSIGDKSAFQMRLAQLLDDDEVTRKSGVYAYMISGDERYLNLRKFDKKIAMKVYRAQKGRCAICGELFDFERMEADHKEPWSIGGRTTEGNCQMLCKQCNLKKGRK